MSYPEVTITIWGPFALWTRPECKVERVSYPVPTPSGIRGVLASIYSKPSEFYWQVRRIEVLNPIAYTTFRRNEVKSKLSRIKDNDPLGACIDIEEDRTQRQSVVLKDVRYRITAQIVPRKEFDGTIGQLLQQFDRRVKRGQMFAQPCMGTREYPAYFEWGSTGEPSIEESRDLGLMLYDVFDLHEWKVGKKANPSVSVFHAKMVNGTIEVPEYNSNEVLKPGKGVSNC